MESSSVGSVAANPNKGKFQFTLNHYTITGSGYRQSESKIAR
jgi:hypothetical protein